MTIQRPFTLASGALCALTATIHTFLGGRDIIVPLLNSHNQDKLETEPTLVLHSCWHLVTVSLIANSALLIAHGLGQKSISILGRELMPVSPEVCSFVNNLNFLHGLVFIIIGGRGSKKQKEPFWKRLFVTPQWILFMAMFFLAKDI